MYLRNIKNKIMLALTDTPVVMVVGPRQCGKTTLVKQIMAQDAVYVTLDDINQLAFAKSDPVGFIHHFKNRHVIIDEVQRVPELFLPTKQAVDENRLPGRFLLTGSANAMALPKVADSLAGRLEVISLLPLAECELQSKPSNFLATIFSGQLPETKQTQIRELLISKVLAGGFPEALLRKETSRRVSWFNQYIFSIVQKDIKDLGTIENLSVMPRLIQMLCNQAGNLINYTDIGNSLELSRQTTNRYLKLLEQLFIFQELPAWSRNDNKRLIKTPKVHLVDSGLLCALRRINEEKLNRNATLFGSLLESYVLCELRRMASWYDEPIYFSHYRDKDKVEVDIVLETISGEVIGIEVKSSATLKKEHFQGLQRLKNAAGKNFLMGILLYDGGYSNAFESDIFSAPLAVLWE